jgi:hypothetical protein
MFGTRTILLHELHWALGETPRALRTEACCMANS